MHTIKPLVLLSLMRSSQGLCAWISNEPATENVPPLSCIALAELPTTLYPQRDALLADWSILCATRELDTVWPAFWRVFWSTLSETQDHAPLAMPRHVAPPSRPSATAAHPRAFRGTKFKPPKRPLPTLDLGTWLGDDRLLDGFFARRDYAHLPVLSKHGLPLPEFDGTSTIPTVSGLLAHDAGLDIDQMPALPAAFRRVFLSNLRARPLHDLMAWLYLWRGLGNATGEVGQAHAARLCALAPGAHAWSALALNLSPARQLIFLKALLAHRSYQLDFGLLSAAQLFSLDAGTADDQRFQIYLNAVLDNLNRRVSAAYTLCGCALANRVTEPYRVEQLNGALRATNDCAAVPMADIDRMSIAVGTDRSFWALTAWENCSLLPGFDRVLRDTCWEKLGAEAADQWLAIFQCIMWDAETQEKIAKRWQVFMSLFPEWNNGLMTLSGPWQEKYVSMLRSYTDGWDDADHMGRSVPYLLALQRRLCHPPFSSTIDGDCVLSCMAINLSADGWQQLAAIGERTWLIAEQACRRENDGALIGRGLFSLTQCWPVFLMQAFSTAPKRLMRTVRLLGCLAYERRRQFLAETSHSEWFSTKWKEINPFEACRQLYRLCLESGVDSPVPRRLRDHFEGRTELTSTQIERHCRVSMARLPTTLLAALEQKIWCSIDTPFALHARSSAASHAVRLLAGLDGGNRKGLRRFLLAYCHDRRDTSAHHPLNRAWWARHPRIDAQAWRTNPPATGTAEIALAFETDPLEILMLGTYVGSCLGLGGLCDYSAVACLLDANKQVVYARNAAGHVLARQLLAIDEDDRLVCFAVYPVTTSEELLSAFHAFDEALASAMGIEIYRHQDNQERYQVATILAQEWWDDGFWHSGPGNTASTSHS